MIQQILGTEWSEKVPTDIPIYNIAGDEDPVGRYGEGVHAVSNWSLETGHQVKTNCIQATAMKFTTTARFAMKSSRALSTL